MKTWETEERVFKMFVLANCRMFEKEVIMVQRFLRVSKNEIVERYDHQRLGETRHIKCYVSPPNLMYLPICVLRIPSFILLGLKQLDQMSDKYIIYLCTFLFQKFMSPPWFFLRRVVNLICKHSFFYWYIDKLFPLWFLSYFSLFVFVFYHCLYLVISFSFLSDFLSK